MWGKIKGFFSGIKNKMKKNRKRPSKQTNQQINKTGVTAKPVAPSHLPATLKIALIKGHTATAGGAQLYNNISEYFFAGQVAPPLAYFLDDYTSPTRNFEAKIFDRTGKTMAQVEDEVTAWGATITIELHVNSYHQRAFGLEILAQLTDKDSIVLADFLSDHLSATYGIKQRDGNGVKEVRDRDRGGYNLRVFDNKRYTSILLEPVFGNIETEESVKVISNPDFYAQTIFKGLVAFYDPKQEVA